MGLQVPRHIHSEVSPQEGTLLFLSPSGGGQVKRRLIPVLQDLVAGKECKIENAYFLPSTYAISSVLGKSAI
jgi:hypothetical protein